MPSKRTRTRRNRGVSSLVLAQLGVGCGINHIPLAELKALWQEYGQQAIDYNLRHYDDEPFVAHIAREEGWPPLQKK